jgi:hypothetical protein
LEIGICAAEDEGVVARVDGGCDECGGFGISTRDGDEISAWNLSQSW